MARKYHDVSLIIQGWFDEDLIVPPNVLNPNLAGQTGTFSAGSITPQVAYALSALTGTFTEGSFTGTLAYGITGQSGTFTEGTISGASDKSITGQSATFTEGTETVSLSLNLSGIVVSTIEGTITAVGPGPGTSIEPYVGLICNVGSLMNH